VLSEAKSSLPLIFGSKIAKSVLAALAEKEIFFSSTLKIKKNSSQELTNLSNSILHERYINTVGYFVRPKIPPNFNNYIIALCLFEKNEPLKKTFQKRYLNL